MRSLDYQRTIIAYHGCDESVVRKTLLTGEPLAPSENDYDWLGTGIYFWEFGPERALEWAQEVKRRDPKRIRKPSVIGAVINLGACFDLLDTRHTALLADGYNTYQRTVPTPHPINQGLRHHLDCDVINFVVPLVESFQKQRLQTVRGSFQEGSPAFPGSDIRTKSHIQIVVRDVSCILGYFRPQI